MVAFEDELVVFVGGSFEESRFEDSQDNVVEEVAGGGYGEEVAGEKVGQD